MFDSKLHTEKRFNKETHRVIGEQQLQNYRQFLESYRKRINKSEESLKRHFTSETKLWPITITISCREDVYLTQLVSSDNTMLSRILFSLGSICQESVLLTKEATNYLYPALVHHGNIPVDEKGNLDHLGDLLELLQKVQLFIRRTIDVINLIVQQICAMLGKVINIDTTSTVCPEIFDSLASLLICLATLDALTMGTMVRDHWKIYRRVVRSVSHNPVQFSFDKSLVHALDDKILELEDELLTGNIMQRALKKCLESNLGNIKYCNVLNEIVAYIQQLLCDLERDEECINFFQLSLQANVMIVLHSYLNESCDKKLLKRLLEVNKRVSACPLTGNVLWYPEQFLLTHIPTMTKFIDIKTISSNRNAQISQRVQNLRKELSCLCLQACFWFVSVEGIKKQDVTKISSKHLQDCCKLIVRGMRLAKKVSEFVKWITNLHANEGKPMSKSSMLAVGTLVEILTAFRTVFQRNIMPLSYMMLLLIQQLTYKIIISITMLKKQYINDKHYKEKQMDALSSLVLAERVLKGPNTRERLMIAKLALGCSGLDSNTLKNIRTFINKLELISNTHQLLQDITNCSFLYWHQILFPVYFNSMINNSSDLSRAYLLIAALSDCSNMSTNFEGVAKKYVDESLIMPLRESIEETLRYQTHLHLQLPTLNAFQRLLPRNCKKLTPMLLSNDYINIRHEVEHYLSTMFYNLTTVVLHDWRTYGEMRRLASLQYGLKTVEDNLPVQTLEQGLDVLEIMRNIDVFVSKYMYNLNNQVFVEEWNNNKHLNTINITHVANSIRTHGIGIMSTTVNFTYQFLQNKFYTFSQFMFDEQIKSRLLKDLRYFSANRTELNQLYPYARAEAFHHGIKRLGVNEKGLTYLDLFRKLITQIGNAVGYVRLIRSGGKKCVADATCFLPSLKTPRSLSELLDDHPDHLSPLSKQSADFLKRDIKILEDNFEEATEYFQLLVNAFSGVFKDSSNVHLRNFYVIIPPLTINFIDHMLNAKERLNKNNLQGCAFTDDGFAIGLAYIVALLDQGNQFDSLHWFQSVAAKQEQEKVQLQNQKAKASKEDQKFQQTLSLTEKRIKSVETEFTLLHYNFSSSRIFFEI